MIFNLLLTFSCEDKSSDTTPPEIKVSNLESGTHMYGTILVEADSWDKEGVEYVELIIDNAPTGVTDSVEPFILVWNSDDYELGTTHTVQCKAYDIHGNYQMSDPVEIFIDVTFRRSFPIGSGYWELKNTVQQTADGGYILTGIKNEDVWLLKLDQFGNKQWEKTLGGSASDWGSSIQQTTDGGYIIVGRTYSYGNGQFDVWLIKTDNTGSEEWNKTYGGNDDDWGYVVQETMDGGFILSAGSKSFSTNKAADIWLIKTDKSGNEVWNKVLGTNYLNAWRNSVQQTKDGGYITYMGIFSLTGNMDDVQLVKLNADGQEEWSTILGESEDEWFFDIHRVINGGLIATGARANGMNRAWLVKISNDSTVEWEQTFDYSTGLSVAQTEDEGYIMSGYYLDPLLDFKIILLKTDTYGNMQWTKTFPGKEGNAVQQTTDGGYIIAGLDESGIVLIKTNAEGNATDHIEVIE